MPRRSLILDTVLNGVFRTAIVFALFLLFRGHNAPGGGFIGGLVVAVALVERYVAGGVPEVDRIAPLSESVVLGVGLFTAAVTGMLGFVWKDNFLASAKWDFHLPMFGDVHLTSPLFFDIGVFLVVVGLGLAVLRSLGGEADRPDDEEPAE